MRNVALILPNYNMPERTDALVQYLNDNRDMLKNMGSNSRQVAEQQFNRDNLSEQVLALLLESSS